MGDGQAGLGHPPWRGGEKGGGFSKRSEHPEAGCLGELGTWVLGNSIYSIGFG